MAAWLLLQVEGLRQHGGNEGYADQLGQVYRCDTTVPNYGSVQGKDRVVLWDKATGILGMSYVDHIEVEPGLKTRLRCPNCDKTQIKIRQTKTPKYRCHGCLAEFDKPVEDISEVTLYAFGYEAGWLDLAGTMSPEEVRKLGVSPESQHSIRAVDPTKLDGAFSSDERRALGTKMRTMSLIGGHRDTVVRVRRGQPAFRAAMLKRFGSVCAFSGPQPAPSLDAAHLYSYATYSIHEPDAGFLLRADLHRLFDRGLVVVNPTNKTISLAPEIAASTTYELLDGQHLQVPISARAAELLGDHRRQWKSSWTQ